MKTPHKNSVMKNIIWSRSIIALAVMVFIMIWLYPTAHAAETIITITNCTDAGLRAEIDGAASNKIIKFNCGSQTITLTGGEININRNTTIDGGGKITLNGNGGSRLFNVNNGRLLTIQNITLTNGQAPNGAGILNNGTVQIINSTLSNHTCTGVDGDGACGVFNANGSSLVVVGSTFTNNSTSNGWGGAIGNNAGTVEIYQTTFTSNSAERGGAISHKGGGSLTVTNSNFEQNKATGGMAPNYRGGAIFISAVSATILNSTFNGNEAARGGAIYFADPSIPKNETLTIKGSTFVSNIGQGTAQVSPNFGPGALDMNEGVLSLSNSTFAFNKGLNTGGIFISQNEVQATIINTTIFGNEVTASDGNIRGGGIQMQSGSSTLTMRNTIFANNNRATCSGEFAINVGSGNVENLGINCLKGTGVSGNPSLGGLNDNGGPTETVGLNSNSVAIDKATSNCPDTDQRGYKRPSGTCDSGAFERNGTPLPVSTVTSVTTNTTSAGEPVYQITVDGANFTTESTVQFNGAAISTKFVNNGQLVAYVPIDVYEASGVAQIGVETDGKTSGTVTVVLNSNSIPPLSVSISGPQTVTLNDSQTYTATIGSITTTLGVDYKWEATDLGFIPPRTNQQSLQNTIPLKWAQSGLKTITVTASNKFGSMSDSYTVTVGSEPTGVSFNGNPDNGEVNVPYDFVVSLGGNSSTPVTYTWDATDQSPVVIANSNRLTSTVPYSWTTSGVKVITLTIQNSFNTVTERFTITINSKIFTVTVSGPTAGTVGIDYDYIATVTPMTTTTPLSFSWQVTDQSQRIVQSNGLTNSQSFNWNRDGVKLIKVTATNAEGAGVGSASITLTVAPARVVISGPLKLAINQAYTFTALTNEGATTPLDYTWTATGVETPMTHRSGLSDSVPFKWDAAGVQTVTVVAANAAGSVSDTHAVMIGYPPTNLAVDGPHRGTIDRGYRFTATVSGQSAVPISYSWTTHEQASINQTSSLTDSVTLTWATTGTKLMTVTADNGFGLATTLHTITLDVGPTAVVITGPTAGDADVSYMFTATLRPMTVKQPVTYSWQATDHSPTTQVSTNSLTTLAAFTWQTEGTKLITVTADNGFSTATDLHLITIGRGEPPVALMITGSTTAILGQDYEYTATVSPTTATRPITYSWQADDKGQIIQIDGGGTRQLGSNSTVNYRWQMPGSKRITVTARNRLDTVTGTYTVMAVQPPESVTINGPTEGQIGATYALTAAINPISTTLPISYVWSPSPALGQGSSVVSYSWSMTGTQMITVVATNLGGTVTDSHAITLTVADNQPHIYLPLVVK